MTLADELKKRAMGLSQKALERLMADEKRSAQVAAAIGKVQRGKEALERGQDTVMKALSFAPRSDFKSVGKKLSGLKRRLRELDEKLEGLGES